MQAELQKSPRQGCVMALLDNPLKYLDRRIGTMTKYLEFIQVRYTELSAVSRRANDSRAFSRKADIQSGQWEN